MPTLLGANTLSTGYEVAQSAMLGQNSYYSRSASGGSQRTFTISCWIKRADIVTGHHHYMYSAYTNANNRISFAILNTNTLVLYAESGSSSQLYLQTNRVFTDVSAWYHIVASVDTTQGTNSNRVKLYVNGVQETSFQNEDYPSQNADLITNTNVYLGVYDTSNNFFNGYLAEFVYVDGSALDPTSFGQFDSSSPTVWKPKDVSGLTFGTTGFYLDFATRATDPIDASGNGNNFSSTNVLSTDHATDTCTNNFAVMNYLDKYSTGGTFTEGNTVVQSTTSNRGIFTSTFGVSSGKWYWEVKTSASGGTHSSDEWNYIGISNLPAPNTDNILAASGTNSNKVYEYAIHGADGDYYNNGDQGTYAASFTTNDIIGVYLDLDNNRIYWSKNGQWADGSGNSDEADPNGYKSVTDPASTPGGFYFPACGDGGINVNKTWQWNFGGKPGFSVSSGNSDPNGYGNFDYPTEGAYALCSKNLAEFGG